MFWKILASILVGAIAWALAPLIGGWIADLQFLPAEQLGVWIATHAEFFGVIVGFLYFLFGRWYPKF